MAKATPSQAPTSLSILGAGWLGTAVAKSLVGHYALSINTRQVEKRDALSGHLQKIVRLQRQNAPADQRSGTPKNKTNLPPVDFFSIELPTVSEEAYPFFATDFLLFTLPPGRGRPDVESRYAEEVRAVIRMAEQRGTGRIIYTSSTSVYGEATGIVTEKNLPSPKTASGRAVGIAEQLLLAASIPVTILRLAGLYGPDRHPGRWYGGKESIPKADAPVNLVHQADVVAAIQSVMLAAAAEKKEVYNVCAAAHPPKRVFYVKAAKAYGLSVPRPLAGGGDSKQINSEKIRKALGWSPRFDDLSLGEEAFQG